MTFLVALQSMLAAEPHTSVFLRWRAYLTVALAMAANALLAFLVGYGTAAAAFNVVTVVLLGFVLAGIVVALRQEMKGAARA
ncbi:MAG TPA: hypothetical protein VF885_16960 [Arthrobacter sp.]